MLSLLFLCVALGLVATRFERLQHLAEIGFATVMALLYLFQGSRFI